jgi:hypothetical protein
LGCLSKALVATVLVGLILSGLGPTTVTSYTVTDIDGSSSVDLVFDTAGSKTVNLSVPQPFKTLSAQMNISGSPLVPGGSLYPRNVSVDVGSDGTVEWAFNGTGYGPLGHQDRFSDGSTIKELTVANSANKDFDLLIPKDATITSASMTLAGLPTTAEHYSSILPNETIVHGADKDYNVPGIDPDDIAINSSVALKEVVVMHKKVDVNQSRSTTSWGFLMDYQVAQSFRINRTDPRQKTVRVTAIAISFGATSTSGLDLNLIVYNSTKAANYRPTGDVIGTSYAGESQLVDKYLNFSFNDPLELEPGRVYTMLLGDYIVGGTLPFARYHKASSGTNADSAYPLTDCFLQTSNDGGTTWVPNDLADLTFRTYGEIARPITIPEASSIIEDGVPPTKIVGTTLYYNQTPRYNSSGWNFNVNNSLSSDALFNLS